MFASPFPATVAYCCYTIHDEPQFLLPREEQQLLGANAVEVRRTHFTLGRAAAHQALQDLTGVESGPILMGPRRDPLWPQGIVGTITHSGEVACAAVARQRDHAGIGLDIEIYADNFDCSIARHVCTESEASWVKSAASAGEEQSRLRRLFCAKECVFKAFFPLARVELDFLDAELNWKEATQCFLGRLLVCASDCHTSGFEFKVRCQVSAEYVFASLILPHGGQSA